MASEFSDQSTQLLFRQILGDLADYRSFNFQVWGVWSRCDHQKCNGKHDGMIHRGRQQRRQKEQQQHGDTNLEADSQDSSGNRSSSGDVTEQEESS